MSGRKREQWAEGKYDKVTWNPTLRNAKGSHLTDERKQQISLGVKGHHQAVRERVQLLEKDGATVIYADIAGRIRPDIIYIKNGVVIGEDLKRTARMKQAYTLEELRIQL